MPVVQVSFSTLDLARTTAWYQDVLGFLPAGGLDAAGGAQAAAMMGLPSVSCDMRWLVDTSDFFQLEFFGFREPAPRPGRRRPDDIGWNLVGLDVTGFDAALGRLSQAGTGVGPVVGTAPFRRVCCRDPEGAWLELRERGVPAPCAVRAAPVTTVFIRAVVPDLARARRFFTGALGLHDRATPLHGPGDEALWDGEPAATVSCVLAAPGDPYGCGVELVQYTARTPRPRPDDYRISDQGLLNVAFGSRLPADYQAVTAQASAGGYQVNDELAIGSAASRYLLDDQGISVELLTIPDPAIERDFGFRPAAG
jgi:catechol 2,3-dioxygenase-like lactoylglutathione lyase family enzyme